MPTIRPATPAEVALGVQFRERPSIIIFPPQDSARFQELIGTVGNPVYTTGGRIVISEEVQDGGALAVLAVIEWAKLSMLRYYGLEEL